MNKQILLLYFFTLGSSRTKQLCKRINIIIIIIITIGIIESLQLSNRSISLTFAAAVELTVHTDRYLHGCVYRIRCHRVYECRFTGDQSGGPPRAKYEINIRGSPSPQTNGSTVSTIEFKNLFAINRSLT